MNERIESLQRRFATTTDEPLQLVCECDQIECSERISVSTSVYERVRSDPHLFLIVPDHADTAVEAIVDGGGGYLVVRKRPGTPQDVAEQTDPRT